MQKVAVGGGGDGGGREGEGGCQWVSSVTFLSGNKALLNRSLIYLHLTFFFFNYLFKFLVRYLSVSLSLFSLCLFFISLLSFSLLYLPGPPYYKLLLIFSSVLSFRSLSLALLITVELKK